MMPFEIFIGLRYLRAKRRNSFISFISLISIVGIALGVAALIIVLSVMNGFQTEIRGRILGVASHIEITGLNNTLHDWPLALQTAQRDKRVVAAAPYVTAQGLLSTGGTVRGVMVRGIDPAQEAKVVSIGEKMLTGALTDLHAGEWGMVLGVELARQLGVGRGDKVTLITPQGQITPAGMLPRLKQFTVVGVFKVDMFEYDASLAMIQQRDAQTLFRLGDSVSGVRLKLQDLLAAPAVKQALVQQLPPSMYIADWTEQHANYFRAVQIEKRMMFIILTLIVAVAAFNLVSTLVMTVTDKQADIAILRTLGASPRSIMAIFMVQGTLSGVIGTLAGVASGVLVALNLGEIVSSAEHALGVKILSSEVYLIDRLPSDVVAGDVLTITLISLLLALLATLYPSWRASRTQPAEALRYE